MYDQGLNLECEYLLAVAAAAELLDYETLFIRDVTSAMWSSAQGSMRMLSIKNEYKSIVLIARSHNIMFILCHS